MTKCRTKHHDLTIWLGNVFSSYTLCLEIQKLQQEMLPNVNIFGKHNICILQLNIQLDVFVNN